MACVDELYILLYSRQPINILHVNMRMGTKYR